MSNTQSTPIKRRPKRLTVTKPKSSKGGMRSKGNRSSASAACLTEQLADLRAQLDGERDAQRELQKDRAHTWEEPPVSNDVFALEDDIFVANYLIKSYYIHLVLACALVAIFFLDVSDCVRYSAALGVMILFGLAHSFQPSHVEIRARTNFLHDEIDDRPTTDRGRSVVLGRVYELDYYWILVAKSPTGPLHIHSSWMPSFLSQILTLDPGFTAFVRRHSLYTSKSLTHAVQRDCISTSCIQQLLGRKTIFSRDPQYTTLAQRLDMISTNRALLMTRGISVGNCTIKYLRLVHASTPVQPFQHLLPVVPSSTDTGYTTQGSPPSTRPLRIILRLLSSLTSIPSLILAVLRWLALVGFTLLAIACLGLILQTLYQSSPDARSDLLFDALQLAQKWVGTFVEGSGGSPSSSYHSFTRGTSSHHSKQHQPSFSGSSKPTTPAQESTNFTANSSRSGGTTAPILRKFVVVLASAALTTCAKGVATMLTWALGVILRYYRRKPASRNRTVGLSEQEETDPTRDQVFFNAIQVALAVAVLITLPPTILGMWWLAYYLAFELVM